MNKNLLIVCPNEEKMNILDTYQNDNNLHNIKFMNKKEFIDNYYFKYDENALVYLMNKYNYNLDVCKVYLKNLYVIDINKEYNSNKLNFLKEIKKELLENNLLEENKGFHEYLKDKEIVVKNYYDLDKYEEIALNYKVEVEDKDLNIKVVSCKTLEQEVNDVALKIIKLLNSGIDINKIYLANVNNDYLYTIDKIFKYYKIPINLNMNYSIYSTKVVSDYLKTKELDLENQDNMPITRKLVNVLNSLSKLDNTTEEYNKILIDKLKSTTISQKKLKNAINVVDIFKTTIKDDEYVFVLSFNQDILPKMQKDIEYIDDSIKNEVDMYTSNELNVREKKVLKYILANIKNLNISYKLTTPFSSFYKSSMIGDYNLEEIDPIEDKLVNSNIYNKLRLGEKLDTYYMYLEKDDILKTLYTHYDIPYNTYSNEYKNINKDNYLNNLSKPLKLSYSAIDSYNQCAFKYYIDKILNLNIYEEKFSAFIGSLYHKILSIYRKDNFNEEMFNNVWDNFISNKKVPITNMEMMLLERLKEELIKLINELKRQQLMTGHDVDINEKEFEVAITDKKIEVIFKGFIDKIMTLNKNGLTYYSIVDYKTGGIDTDMEPLKYGLHMQLPSYLYLINKTDRLTNPVFTGMYYQRILFDRKTSKDNDDYIKEYRNDLKLIGYSTDDEEVLERFDTTYEKSELIHSMAKTKSGDFGRYAKLLDKQRIEEIVDYTEKQINKAADNIIDRKFTINPKHYEKEIDACKFCSYKDICFMKETDIKYLSKVESIDEFLGGEE